MTKKLKNRGRRGFTLAEILAAIGILSILMAVAVPSVISMRNDMNILELDDSARQIFAAAQNRMVSLRNSGQMEALPGSQMSAPPVDYPADGMDWDEEFYYVTKTNAERLLPPGSIDDVVRANYYVIEYHKPSGMVYGVFYSKSPIAYTTGMSREKSERKRDSVGYYGGASIHYTPSPLETGRAALGIDNGERLTLRLTAEAQTAYQITVSGTQGETAAYEFSFDYNGFEMAAQRYPGQLSWRQEAGETVYELLLDGAPGEARFRTLFPELTPGADVEITVSATAISAEGGSLATASQLRVNSLFAAREENTALLSSGRHLQNLEPGFSGVSGVAAAQMTDDITWTHKEQFMPIVNDALIRFDGAGLDLRNLDISRNGVYAGLFGRYQGELLNLRLIDARLDEPRADYAGLFVGQAARGVMLRGCYAYAEDLAHLDAYPVIGGRFVGGLVGESQGAALQDSFAAIPHISAARADGAAGGLVGRMTAGKVQGCYAASGYMGAETDVYQGGVSAAISGGLVGTAAGGSIADCYAVGWIGGEGLCGALVGESSDALTIQNAYTAVLSQIANLPFAGAAVLQNCCMLQAAQAEEMPEGLSYVDVEGLARALPSGAFTSDTKDVTAPYTLEGAYPYPRLSHLPHYGDWPVALLPRTAEPLAEADGTPIVDGEPGEDGERIPPED